MMVMKGRARFSPDFYQNECLRVCTPLRCEVKLREVAFVGQPKPFLSIKPMDGLSVRKSFRCKDTCRYAVAQDAEVQQWPCHP